MIFYMSQFVFNNSIDDGINKLKFPCMIGSIKPAQHDNFQALASGADPHVIYYGYLKAARAACVEQIDIGGITYYYALE